MNKIGKVLLVMVVLCTLLTGCAKDNRYDGVINYIDIVSEKADMSGYERLTDEDHVFEKIKMSDVVRMFEEGGSGLVYFGYTHCGWCNAAVPVINEVAKKNKQTIYYVDVNEPRDGLDKVMEYSDKFVRKEEGKPTFFVPAVYAIRNGECIDVHISTVPSHTNAYDRDLTKDERKKLVKIYKSLFEYLIEK